MSAPPMRSAGIMNAWRGNIPVLFTAGRTPYSEEGGLTGQRTGEIHWPQEMRDQRAIVREFTNGITSCRMRR